MKPPPRSLTQALQAAQPPAALPAPSAASPPQAQHAGVCPTPQQAQQQLPAQQSQPKQQQKQHPLTLPPAQPGQQAWLPVQPQVDGPALVLAPELASRASLQAAAPPSNTQQVGPREEERLGVSTELDQDLPTPAEQSHVSASPSRSSGGTDRQAGSQQQQHFGEVETIDDSATHSSHKTGASQSRSGCRLVRNQPAPHRLIGLSHGAERAVAACAERLPGAALRAAGPREKGPGEGPTRSGPLPAALEPAGPVADPHSEGTGIPASVDRPPQPGQQQPKHGACMIQAGVGKQKRKARASLPGDQAPPERRPRLTKAAARVAEHKSRNVSCEAAALPAESQQSAVHAGLPASPHRYTHVEKNACTGKVSMQAVRHRTPLDGGTSSRRVKRTRAEVEICAVVKDVEQSRMHGGTHLLTMPAVSHVSQPAGEMMGTGRPGRYESGACDPLDCPKGCHDGAVEAYSEHAPEAAQGQHTPAQSRSMAHETKTEDKTSKRSSRRKDSDANKPWWMV